MAEKRIFSQYQKCLIQGSINWVSAIATNGLCMNLFKYWTTTLKEIRWFIELVIEYLQKNQGIKPNEVGIILDNWAWHRARSVIEYCNSIDISLYFIPPYCPEMAPVEVYFSELKRKFIKTSQSNSLNLESEACINKIKLWVFSTDQACVRRLWCAFISKLTCNLDNLRSFDGIQTCWNNANQ